MILNVSTLGVVLSKEEQRKITGGLAHCRIELGLDCAQNECCNGKICRSSPGASGSTSC